MRHKKVWLILILNLLLLGAALAWYFHTPPLSVACDGNLTFSDRRDSHDFTFDGEIIMRFHPDKTGYITLNGSVVNAPRSLSITPGFISSSGMSVKVGSLPAR